MRRGFRKLHLDSGVWEYRIGTANIQIFSPAGLKFCPTVSEVTGLSWDAIERGRYKRTGENEVVPSQVREWILNASEVK